MGIRLFGSNSNSCFDYKKEIAIEKPLNDKQNPDPTKYVIVKSYQYCNHLIIFINYLNCTNFEGDKILVFENCTIEDLLIQKKIDPHFSNNNTFHSPIARFEPTDRGWRWAQEFVKIMYKPDPQ